MMGTLADRLWSRVGAMPNGCREWQGCRDKGGYGKIKNGRVLKTHRAAWEVTYGPIPYKIHVLHRCDNPPCCNPDHLFLGTRADNMADMDAKGRRVTVVGEASVLTKYTDEQVAQMREMWSQGWTQQRIADLVGCTRSNVSYIVNGKSRAYPTSEKAAI